jgi:regulator of sigma E protease
MPLIVSVVVFLAGLALLVYLHELGHVAAAKALGVRVEVCCFGFGPTVFQHRIGDTFWRVAAIPFGGWTKLAGELRAEATGDPQEFVSRPLWVRLAIGAMGAVANVSVALLLAIDGCLTGFGPVRATTVLVVRSESGALAGMKPGDAIMSVNGAPAGFCDQLAGLFEPDADQIIYRRGTQIMTSALHPSGGAAAGRCCPLLSAGAVVLDPPQDGIAAVVWSVGFVKRFVSMALDFLGRVVTFRLSPRALPGPIRFLQLAAGCDVARPPAFLILLSMASVWMAVFNLIPIPILDGGVILTLVIEEVAGEMSPRLREAIYKMGFVCLMVIVVFFIHNDINRLPFLR